MPILRQQLLTITDKEIACTKDTIKNIIILFDLININLSVNRLTHFLIWVQ
jgi:hypothetical protein